MSEYISNKISVLMGAYNCEDTVEEAMNCIVNQTYRTWELIICDDGSSDRTYEICCRLSDNEDRIHVIKNDRNRGLAYTLNHCLKYATGEFIARMDGDDRCTPDRFEKEIKALQAQPDMAVVSCEMEFFDNNGVYGISKYKQYPQKKDIIKHSPFCHAGCMMRTSILVDLGGYSTEERVNRMEDYDLWFRLYAKGYYGFNLPDVLYSMRDDRNAYNRRKFKYRICSTKLKWRIFKELHNNIMALPYVFAPIIKGLLPETVYMYLHHKKLSQKNIAGGAPFDLIDLIVMRQPPMVEAA